MPAQTSQTKTEPAPPPATEPAPQPVAKSAVFSREYAAEIYRRRYRTVLALQIHLRLVPRPMADEATLIARGRGPDGPTAIEHTGPGGGPMEHRIVWDLGPKPIETRRRSGSSRATSA